jgi:acyl-CoA thioester hydrolase
MKKHGVGVVVARTTNDFVHEANAGELLLVKSGFTRLGNKSLTYTQRMTNAENGTLIATQDAVEVFFDMEARKSTDMPDEIRAILKDALVSVDDA